MKTKTKVLEPIVAAVLLIMVAVIGAVLVYLWFTSLTARYIKNAERSKTTGLTPCCVGAEAVSWASCGRST